MGRQDTDSVKLRDEVLAYLSAHPQAADSLEGILAWWLPRQRYDQAKQDLANALEGLLAEGLVERIDLASGSTLYRRAARNDAD